MKYAGGVVVFVLCLALVYPPAAAQLKPVEELTSSIELVDREISANEALTVKFVLTNPTGQPVYVLKWFTPFDGFTGDIFEVTRDGQRTPYVGRLVKRGAPRADHYIRVDAGQSVSTEINLLEGYDIYESGNYSLRFDSRLLDLGTGTPETMARKQVFQPKLIRSNQTQFRVLETLPRHKRALGEAGEAGEGVAPKVPAFTDCTQEQQDILTQALADAQNYAMGTHVGLLGVSAGDRPNSPRYKKWFGAYSESRYNTVMTHFEKIYNALANETITFHCDCDEDYYAYVYPNQPYHIYLCNAFWSAPATGSDSRMGTLIHETSHFTIVAGTDDHAYGQSSCQSLAQNDPARAVDNADNHEYIAENNPSDPWKDSGVEHVPFALLAILAVVTLFWFYSRKRLPGAAG